MQYQFYKYQGAGNDFIVIDNREGSFNLKDHKLIEFLCHRRFGIGADGLMTIEECDGYDFKMTYFNSDGFEASMCGNGGRCIVAFAFHLGIIENNALFLAADGEHKAVLYPDGDVDLQMIDVSSVTKHVDGYFLNTGVPHLVHFVDDLKRIDVAIEGRQLRYDARFQPAGTNVNFVKHTGSQLTVYTYERGVESETLACGTGITASALSAALVDGKTEGEYNVTAKGGNLSVQFKKQNDGFTNIWLKGPAKLVFIGTIDTDGFNPIV